MNKLNLGCGVNKKRGFINVDKNHDVYPDKVMDPSIGLTLDPNSMDIILANYILCQIDSNKDFVKTMNEIWRVLKPTGKLIIRVPNAEFPQTAFRDPMDNRRFVPETFDHFNYEHYRWQKLSKNDGFKPWIVLSVVKIAGKANRKVKDRIKAIMRPYKEKNL